jgi:hypothetical protein
MRVKDWMKRMMNVKFIAVIMVMVMAISYFSISGTSPSPVLKVNGVATKNTPIVSGGNTYVPLNEVSQKMGEKVTGITSQKKVVIMKKNKTSVSVKAGQSYAVLNGKVVPLKTKQVNKTTVPVNVKAIYKNGQVFVPIEFISAQKGMTYPVKITKESGKTVIYVGKGAEKPAPQPTQQKPSSNKVQSGKVYPDGWVAPVLKSSWTPNKEKNREIFEKELGFEDGVYYHIPGQHFAITIYDQDDKSDVLIAYRVWQSKSLPASYRIPIVSRELFKFYFGKDADRVWNYFNKNDIPEKFTANGRTVKVEWNEVDARLYVEIGYPNKPF